MYRWKGLRISFGLLEGAWAPARRCRSWARKMQAGEGMQAPKGCSRIYGAPGILPPAHAHLPRQVRRLRPRYLFGMVGCPRCGELAATTWRRGQGAQIERRDSTSRTTVTIACSYSTHGNTTAGQEDSTETLSAGGGPQYKSSYIPYTPPSTPEILSWRSASGYPSSHSPHPESKRTADVRSHIRSVSPHRRAVCVIAGGARGQGGDWRDREGVASGREPFG